MDTIKSTETGTLSGVVKHVPVKCYEKPYYSKNNQVYLGNQLMVWKTLDFFGTEYTGPLPTEQCQLIVNLLNDAYRRGYEKDRYEYTVE